MMARQLLLGPGRFCRWASTSGKAHGKTPPPTVGWVHTDKLECGRCRFKGHALRLRADDSPQESWKALVRDSSQRLQKCSHNIYAFRWDDKSGGGFSDDGEKQAGSRLLTMLEQSDQRNVLVVVSRWYGGSHLGAQRFRAIADAAKEALSLLPPNDASA